MSPSDHCPVSASLAAARHSSPDHRLRAEHDAVVDLLPMAHALARRYDRRGIDLEDLEQVAGLALVKAVRAFDPAAGHLRGYVTVCVLGEIKRHFRDTGWCVRPPRHIQDLQTPVADAMCSEDAAELDVSERTRVAHLLGIDEATVREVLAARRNFRALSLDRPAVDGAPDLATRLGAHDDGFDATDRRLELQSLLSVVDADDRELLRMRFVDEMSQHEIASRTGSTQKQVSRALARIMAAIRQQVRDAAA